MTNPHGSFVWYELLSKDAAAAEAFYTKVVGWKAQPVEGMPYTLFEPGAGPAVAGSMGMMPEMLQANMRAAWRGFIAVSDVDEYAKKVVAAGGTLHRDPQDIPGIGRFAPVSDPQGTEFLLFKGMGEAPAMDMSALGCIGWHELMATDYKAALAFYGELFGWTDAGVHDMGPMGVYQLFGRNGGEAIGGMMNKPAELPHPFWTYFFFVDAATASVERLKAAGGSVMFGPMEVPGGLHAVQAMDNQGVHFCLLSKNP